jgi:hypothetical protein
MDLVIKHYQNLAIKKARIRKQVPDGFLKLITAKNKNEAEKIARNIIIKDDDLSEFILNCGLLDLVWQSKHNQFINDHDKVSDEEKAVFTNGGPSNIDKKIFKKILAEHEKRKYISVHAFFDTYKIKWHVMYFDFNDIAQTNNHYGTPHIHYMSYLWGRNFDFETIWGSFSERKISLPTIHIKWQRK